MGESNQQSEPIIDPSNDLLKVLNTHGHGFHYAVMRRIDCLRTEAKTQWVLAAAEFPVVTGGEPTHIDFVLQSARGSSYVIAECKRVDPALGRWCFTTAPYTRREATKGELIFDRYLGRPLGALYSVPCVAYTNRGIYQLGFELRTKKKGDGCTHNKSGIDTAITQVLRGASGLINHMFEPSRLTFTEQRLFHFIPVIFTTADIYVTELDLGTADLSTGDFESGTIQTQQADWIWFNYNRSTKLRPDCRAEGFDENLAREIARDFTRSVAIVSPRGIDSFLQINMNEWLSDFDSGLPR